MELPCHLKNQTASQFTAQFRQLVREMNFSLRLLASTIMMSIWHVYTKCHRVCGVILTL